MNQLLISELNAKQRHADLVNQAQAHRKIKAARQGRVQRRNASSDFGHAVVIGSGVAGLLAARVVSRYFGRVTIVDRDRFPLSADFRQGVPQAHHAHTLLPTGQAIMEELFPGLTEDLVGRGAVPLDPGRDIAFYHNGVWHTPRANPDRPSVGASRPLLEYALQQRLAGQPGIRFKEDYEVVGLTVDELGGRATGLRLRGRNGASPEQAELAAELVIDASGRGSRASLWLEALGYTAPGETTVNAYTGYASRLYRRPQGRRHDWKMLYVRPTPPHGSRGGVIVPLEGDRWHVSYFGMGGDYPPTDGDAFLDFARSLPVPDLYQALQGAEPLSRPHGYRRTQTFVRHYEALPRYLEGFLVLGDAAYTLNPLYSLGMTAAALGGRALADVLSKRVGARDLTGLAPAFQKALRDAVSRPLDLVTKEDERWPHTEVSTTAPRDTGPSRSRRVARGLAYAV
jgi:2-polyprenyl-6-methoxyphenol hydroxylase-like FAD-dependent oxidoreductase